MGHVVVIGADRGIAAALVREYSGRGEDVSAVCQDTGEAWADTPGVAVIPHVDVTDDAAVAAMTAALGDRSIDILLHVAGVGAFDRFGEHDFPAMLGHYDINALGPLRVVVALQRTLQSGAKVGIVTSRMGSIGDNESGGMLSYRMSKAAANMLGVTLYRELRPRGVAVMLLHPGTAATEMTRGVKGWERFTQPEQAAAGLARQMDRLGPDTPPEFRHADGTLLPW